MDEKTLLANINKKVFIRKRKNYISDTRICFGIVYFHDKSVCAKEKKNAIIIIIKIIKIIKEKKMSGFLL